MDFGSLLKNLFGDAARQLDATGQILRGGLSQRAPDILPKEGYRFIAGTNVQEQKPVSELRKPPVQVLAATAPQPTPRPLQAPDRGAKPYLEAIQSAAKQYGIPDQVFYNLLARESMRFNPDVITGKINSPVGAQGIAQFMPDTAKWWANSHGQFDPLDPMQAIPASAHYLQYLHKQFDDWEKTLAAYNAGEGAVRQYGGIPPYNETQEYVKAILNGVQL
jgi:soluble lytic murein transglycosylase-like protein